MGLFGKDYEQEELEIIEKLLRNEAMLIHLVDKLTPVLPKFQRTHLVLTQIINNQTIFAMNLSLLFPGGNSAGTLALLDENLAPISGATFANIVLSGLDGSVASATTDNVSSVTVTPVAVGTQTLIIDTDVSYTDTNVGATTVHKTVSVDISVTTPAVPQNTTLSITFGPQA